MNFVDNLRQNNTIIIFTTVFTTDTVKIRGHFKMASKYFLFYCTKINVLLCGALLRSVSIAGGKYEELY